MKPIDAGTPATQKNSLLQFSRERGIPRTIQCHFIFLLCLIARMGEPLGEFAVVCEKKEALGLRVEPANVEQTRKFWRQQVEDRVTSMLIFSGRNNAGWFVEDNR